MLCRADRNMDGDKQTCCKSTLACKVGLKGTVSVLQEGKILSKYDCTSGTVMLSPFIVAESAAV